MDRLSSVCERIASYGSRNKKVELLAEYLGSLDDADYSRAVRFLCCGPIASGDHKFSVGGATLRDALLLASGLDSYILGLCSAAVGDTGETAGHLMRGKSGSEPMTLAEAELLYARLYKMRRTADKVELLRCIFLKYRPLTLKFFVKVITGNLRIGLLGRTVEEAVAAACGAAPEEVRAANNRIGDLPKVALAARQGRLGEIQARLFHPMDFMLAKPLDDLADLSDPGDWLVEDKFDGFRSQIHVENKTVMIFTRGMEQVTEAFPELVEAFSRLNTSAVIDGEILAWKDDRALSFNVLQQRIARKSLSSRMAAEVPVVFMGYDLLFRDGQMLLDIPVEGRRRLLHGTLAGIGHPVMIAPQWEVAETLEIDNSFLAAKARGNEGLLLKRKGSFYEPGKRTGAWLKVKRPYGTLDVVVTAAEVGSGRRAIWLSDYTFAVRDGDRFVNVGKAYSGLTDAEVRELTRVLRGAALERFGRVTLVKPEVILEVAFDGIQKSARHKSGYALRFPRILRWRRDKKIDECDTLDRVRELYESSISQPAPEPQ